MFCTIKLLIRSFVLLYVFVVFFFFKQKTAYEMRISDWSSDVCSSDLLSLPGSRPGNPCPSLTPDLSGEARCRGRMGPRDKPEGDNWRDRKSTRLNSSHSCAARMPSSA